MAGIDLSTAEAHLQFWLAADEKLARGQAVTFDGRSISRSDSLAKVEYWNGWVQRLSRGGRTLTRVTGRG